jgi:hypothetical protein
MKKIDGLHAPSEAEIMKMLGSPKAVLAVQPISGADKYLFAVKDTEDGPQVSVTKASYFKQHGYVDDRGSDQAICPGLGSNGYEEICEALFESTNGATREKVHADFLAMGFKEDQAFTAFIDSCTS